MSFDILQDFSKPEIIQWVRENAFARVKKSALLSIRWKLASESLQRDYRQEMDDWNENKPDFSERDSLARQFNESKDTLERLKILDRIRPYDLALKQHMERCKKLDQRQERIESMYRQYEKQRDIEREKEPA